MTNSYYFTFGPDQYPFPDQYVVVVAETIEQATEYFNEAFPHPFRIDGSPYCEGVYTRAQWNLGPKGRHDGPPVCTIEEVM